MKSRSAISRFVKKLEDPNNTFVQLRKKNVGANKYNRIRNAMANHGKKSNKKEKKSISAINIIEPGKPKKTNRFSRLTRKSLGARKLIPLISVTRRVLKRRPIASTNKKEFVESKA